MMWSLLAGIGVSPAPLAAQSSNPQAAPPTAGPRFLVRLEDKLSTKKDKAGKKFEVKTLEPVTTADGRLIPAGTTITGHVSRVEPASVTGRARLWLTFDEIRAREGKTPIVADVVDVPGERSVRAGTNREGEIEARTSRGQREVEAAIAGAAIGAIAGGAAKGGKGAAVGAAVGAIAGFLMASGMAQEIELQKGTKLELELARPIYLARR
ncbi:MAG TPA: hypothetical protein VNL38_02305 [Candidatus Nitrosotenuis sp.]|nr:hypothetical protein [Candidatus Nitrosotenuis sp.]